MGVRKNPTPAKGVAAAYEEKETALCKSREAGSASCSSRGPQETQNHPPEGRRLHSDTRQAQGHEEASDTRQAQAQTGGQTKDGENKGDSQTACQSFISPPRKRTICDADSPGS